jgi:hypothetical protein
MAAAGGRTRARAGARGEQLLPPGAQLLWPESHRGAATEHVQERATAHWLAALKCVRRRARTAGEGTERRVGRLAP